MEDLWEFYIWTLHNPTLFLSWFGRLVLPLRYKLYAMLY